MSIQYSESIFASANLFNAGISAVSFYRTQHNIFHIKHPPPKECVKWVIRCLFLFIKKNRTHIKKIVCWHIKTCREYNDYIYLCRRREINKTFICIRNWVSVRCEWVRKKYRFLPRHENDINIFIFPYFN